MGNFLSKNINETSYINKDCACPNPNVNNPDRDYELINGKIIFKNYKSLLDTIIDKDKCSILLTTLNSIIENGLNTFNCVCINPCKINSNDSKNTDDEYNLTPVAYLCDQLNKINNPNINLMIKFMIHYKFNNPVALFVVNRIDYNELTYTLYKKQPNITNMLLKQNESKLLNSLNIALKEGYENICQSIIDKKNNEIEPTNNFINNYVKYCNLYKMYDLYIQLTAMLLLDPIIIKEYNSIDVTILYCTVRYSHIYCNYETLILLIKNFKYNIKTLNELYECISTDNMTKSILRSYVGFIYKQKLIHKLDDSLGMSLVIDKTF